MECLVIANRRINNATYFESIEGVKLYLSQHPETKQLVFAFWSDKVPTEILEKYEVYGLHTGPLLEGKGKGGSPIDNLQALEVRVSTLCAFTMTDKFDEGKVHLAVPIRLNLPKSEIVGFIDSMIPYMVDYLSVQKVENERIPEKFRRIKK